MAKSPKKNTPKFSRPAPGKTVLPRQKFQPKQASSFKQRRFSIIDSDSSSLSDYESDEDEVDDSHKSAQNKSFNNKYSGKFQAIESESEEDDNDEDEQLWKSNANKVVNTSSEDEEDDDDSSSDDENVDFVKLTAERKKRAMESYRSASPFHSISPSKDHQDVEFVKPEADVDFSFDFNNNDHQLRITNDEEEDVGEELSQLSPIKDSIAHITGEPLGFMNIEESSGSDDEINRDELLRTLEQDSDDGIDTGIETGDDELTILRHEADMIAQEYDEDGLQLSSTNATPRNSVVENLIRQHKSDMQSNEVLQFVSDDENESPYEDDEDDEFDADDAFMIPYFDDSVFKEQLYLKNSQNHQHQKSSKHDQELDSDDDSYLWDYFFSSGEEDNGNNSHDYNNHNSNQYSDDETTDEDTTLPPPSSRKKIGSKAQELLSSSSVSVRPPTLGTWSTDSKPFGIIDGLSTRSLLPNYSARSAAANHSHNSSAITGHASKALPMSNNIEEFALDELLNMSELEDEGDDDLNHETWLEVTGSNRNVPLSAFRNKGVVDDHDTLMNATRRFSSSQGTSNISKSSRRRASMTVEPASEKRKIQHSKVKFNEVQSMPIAKSYKKGSKNKRNSVKMKRRQSIAEAAVVEGLRVTKSGLFSEDTLNNVEEFLSGLGNETELSILFREVQ